MSHKRTINAIHQHIQRHYHHHWASDNKALANENIVTVSAEIAEFLSCEQDLKGNMHQHFYVQIKEVLVGNKELVKTTMAYVAVHFGDEDSLKEPIPGIIKGASIIIRGKYVPATKAYKTDDNPGFSVLHFTHHPIGYIEYNGIRYE